jgi:hypothetical protein
MGKLKNSKKDIKLATRVALINNFLLKADVNKEIFYICVLP